MDDARRSEALAGLAAGLGLPALALDQQGEAAVEVGDALVVGIRAEQRTLALEIDLGRLPPDDGAWAASLLDANLFGAGSGGGRFGRSPEGTIVLRRMMPLDDGVDGARLLSRFERLSRAALAWHERLAAERAREEGDA